MDFQEAIQKIEERGDFNRYAEVKPAFEEQLKNLKPGDHTERGLCYYYLLVSYLKAQLVHETEESVDYFEKMDEAFASQEEEYREHPKKITREEVQDFYRLMERCYNSLEFLYQRHDFKFRKVSAYERKMHFRKDSFWAKKQYGKWLEYRALEITCLYGTSVSRWAVTTFAFLFLVSFGYMAIDLLSVQEYKMIPHDAHWFDYFYYSLIVLTTVGLGDIYPLTLAGKMLTAGEAFFGFMMLGIFIGMIQKKL